MLKTEEETVMIPCHCSPSERGHNNHIRNNLHRGVSNFDIVGDLEVTLAPNFDSENPNEVLGCHSAADIEELDRAYRNLSRKYHPLKTSTGSCIDENDNSHSSAHNRLIFLKVNQAHARATGKEKIPMTQEEAYRAYESMFGKYRDLYYNDGGLIGIPYSTDLKERLEKTESFRDWTSFSLYRFGGQKILRIVFFRTVVVKKEMNFWLCLAEIFLTWTVMVFCE
jgi:hypothetical protein